MRWWAKGSANRRRWPHRSSGYSQSMGRNQRIGWALIACAGLLSTGIVSLEIYSLVTSDSAVSSETLPTLEFEPAGED